jgi:hypothetical protein
MDIVDNMGKPCIRLYEHTGIGVIIENTTGTVYSNQAGGTACLQPVLEGAFVPFKNDVLIPSREFISPEWRLADYFEGPKYGGTGATSGLDDEDADFINSVLKEAGVDSWIVVDRKRLSESCEAWVFVNVLADEGRPDVSICSGFGPYPRGGVLTWSNSD